MDRQFDSDLPERNRHNYTTEDSDLDTGIPCLSVSRNKVPAAPAILEIREEWHLLLRAYLGLALQIIYVLPNHLESPAIRTSNASCCML
jgi:hypothetical protein